MSEHVAVITDIHANQPALEAVLADIAHHRIERMVCGGDLVGYGPYPDTVCHLVEERAIPTIYGNYDYAIARDLDDCGCEYKDAADKALGDQSVAWALAHTNQRSKTFMRGLPFDVRFQLAGRRVRLVHGSPRRVNEYRFQEKPARTYERIAGLADCDVLVFGHTHKPWINTFADVLFVNCGSVGKPKDGDPRAAYAVLKAVGDDVRARIRRVTYDAPAVARQMRAGGLPDGLADKLLAAI
jgi:putative phosphoesterase